MQPEPVSDERAEAEFLAEARSNLPRNYLAHLLHGLGAQTGFRLLNSPTFIPTYIFLLSGSEVFVGLARGVQSLGQCLTPMFSATMIEHRSYVKRQGLIMGGFMRLQVLGIALAGFFLTPEWALPATLLFLAGFGLFLGMQGVIFGILMSKVIPVDVRGRLQGLRNFLGGLTAAAVGILGGRFVEADLLGNGYAATFALAFVLSASGLAMISFIREPAAPRVRERQNFAGRLGDLPALLRRDPDFTAYFILRALASLGRVAVPYYVIFAASRMDVGGAELGTWHAAWTLAMTSSNLLWGLMADRTGFRAVFLAAMAIWIGSVMGLMYATDVFDMTLVFIGVGVGMGGYQLSQQNLVLEFGSRQNLPLRMGVANTASELTAGLGLLLSGLLVVQFSYLPVFWIAIGFKVLAGLLMLVLVREPRFRSRGERR